MESKRGTRKKGVKNFSPLAIEVIILDTERLWNVDAFFFCMMLLRLALPYGVLAFCFCLKHV
jgi:hypothetical protein